MKFYDCMIYFDDGATSKAHLNNYHIKNLKALKCVMRIDRYE